MFGGCQVRGRSSGLPVTAASTLASARSVKALIDCVSAVNQGPLPAAASARCCGCPLRFLNLDDLTLDVDLHVVADDELAIEHHVEPHPEVLAIDLALGGVADPMTHVRIVELAVPDELERHRPGVALDGQVTGQGVAIGAGGLDRGALEGHGRVLVDLEEVGRPEVVVPLLVVRADARGIDGGLYGRAFGCLWVNVARRGDLGKVTAHRHHAQVLGRELNLSVQRIEFPGAHRDYLRCVNWAKAFIVDLRTDSSLHLFRRQSNLAGCRYTA